MNIAKSLVFAALCTAASGASAAKPCDELKSEIEAKLQSKGVTAYTLTIVAKTDAGEGKVVGSCEGGSKSIVYSRGAAAAATPAE